MYLILLGAPGAGKGTQAAIVAQKLGLTHLSSGDLFRQALEKRTKLGILAKSYMERGALVPDEITTRMVVEQLNTPDCDSGYVFDGFPRTLKQAEALDEALAGYGKGITTATYIKVSNEELLKRLSQRWICRHCQTPCHATASPPRIPGKCDKCGGELYQRPDDAEETVKERLKVYFAQTTPVLDYYRRAGKLIEVNGELGIEEVTREIMNALNVRASKSK